MRKEGHKVLLPYLFFYFWIQVFFKNYIIASYKYENNAKTPLMLNTYATNVPLLNPFKKSENQRFSAVFRGCRSRTLVENGLKLF